MTTLDAIVERLAGGEPLSVLRDVGVVAAALLAARRFLRWERPGGASRLARGDDTSRSEAAEHVTWLRRRVPPPSRRWARWSGAAVALLGLAAVAAVPLIDWSAADRAVGRRADWAGVSRAAAVLVTVGLLGVAGRRLLHAVDARPDEYRPPSRWRSVVSGSGAVLLGAATVVWLARTDLPWAAALRVARGGDPLTAPSGSQSCSPPLLSWRRGPPWATTSASESI